MFVIFYIFNPTKLHINYDVKTQINIANYDSTYFIFT